MQPHCTSLWSMHRDGVASKTSWTATWVTLSSMLNKSHSTSNTPSLWMRGTPRLTQYQRAGFLSGGTLDRKEYSEVDHKEGGGDSDSLHLHLAHGQQRAHSYLPGYPQETSSILPPPLPMIIDPSFPSINQCSTSHNNHISTGLFLLLLFLLRKSSGL